MMDLVSVIVPVYNVESYIDRCMDSVVNQTYKNLEILVMEAESSDGSLEKVKRWAELDTRIKVTSRKDGGLGLARNYAIDISKGMYIIFVDSDDWIDKDLIERLVQKAAQDEETDVVMADAKRIYKNKVIDIIGPEWEKEEYSSVDDKKELLCFASNFIWGKLFKRNIFIDNKIFQPQLPFEDLCVFAEWIAVAKKIATCHGTYAYYEVGREDSLSQVKDTYKSIIEVYNFAKKELVRLGYYDDYEDAFNLSMYMHFRIILKHCIGNDRYKNLSGFDSKTNAFLDKYFKKYRSCNYEVLGGFSLRWIAHECLNGFESVSRHYCFTSIPAQMSKPSNARHIYNNNIFREKCVNDDIKGFFSLKETNDSTMLLMDMLQECVDLYIDGENIITKSEAFDGSGGDIFTENMRTIQFGSGEFWDLWEYKCKEFINVLKRRYTRTILVENYYAEYFISQSQTVHYITSVTEKNRALYRMYNYFENNFPQCIIVKPNYELAYTDMLDRPYPPSGEYYNNGYYRNTARKIHKQIGFEAQECKATYE